MRLPGASPRGAGAQGAQLGGVQALGDSGDPRPKLARGPTQPSALKDVSSHQEGPSTGATLFSKHSISTPSPHAPLVPYGIYKVPFGVKFSAQQNPSCWQPPRSPHLIDKEQGSQVTCPGSHHPQLTSVCTPHPVTSPSHTCPAQHSPC